MNGEDVPVGLLVLLHHVAFARVGPEAPRIDCQHVDARLALDDPLGELPSGSAGRGDTEAVALIEPDIAHTPGRADEGSAVGRVGNGAVDDVLDAAVLERRYAPGGRFDVRDQPIEIAGKEAA